MRRRRLLEARLPNWRDPFGSFTPALLAADWRDHRRHLPARRAARWGYLRPPASGKLLWLACGADVAGIALGVELLRAIREKRLDVQLVLTVEREIPVLLEPLQALNKAAWGFAPSDHPRAVARALRQLSPFAVIFCATSARPNLARSLTAVPHLIAVAAEASVPAPHFERVYPASEAQAHSWRQQPAAPPADMQSLLVEAQVDPNFRTLVNGPAVRHLWWLHSVELAQARAFARRFRTVFPEDVLFISGLPAHSSAAGRDGWKPISRWQRSPLDNGDVMLIDDAKWLPAVAAAVTATHLEPPVSPILWQAMAGGAAISCNDHAALPKHALRDALDEFSSHGVLLHQWQAYRDNPILARERADAARRQFWQERRLAGRVNAELLERIFEW